MAEHKVGGRVIATEPYVKSEFTISPKTVGIIVEVRKTDYVVFWGHPEGKEHRALPNGVKRALKRHQLGPVKNRRAKDEPSWMAEVALFLKDMP